MLDEMRSATQASTLLALVGAGCNRLAEIAARMGKPSGALTRPLTNLLDLGYLRKEVPFGEDERSSKRMLYRIDDPLVALWFRFVQPARTLLQRDLLEPVEATLSTAFPQHCAEAWEVLAREYVPRLRIGGFAWGSASRWWRNGRDALFEFDVVSESLDGESVLFGEAKWASRPDVARWRAELRARDESAPFLRGRRPECALWVKEEAEGGDIITPAAVMAALR